MKAAVALVVAAIGFYAGVAWAGDTAPRGSAAQRPAAVIEPANPLKREAPAATPAAKSRSAGPKIPTLRLPARTGREVICACGRIDKHA